jgi:hypothetical protein
LLLLTNCPNNPTYRLIGNAIIPCKFSERFTGINLMKNSRPLRNGYFPLWLYTWVALLVRRINGWVAVDKNIISAWEKLFKRDE